MRGSGPGTDPCMISCSAPVHHKNRKPASGIPPTVAGVVAHPEGYGTRISPFAPSRVTPSSTVHQPHRGFGPRGALCPASGQLIRVRTCFPSSPVPAGVRCTHSPGPAYQIYGTKRYLTRTIPHATRVPRAGYAPAASPGWWDVPRKKRSALAESGWRIER